MEEEEEERKGKEREGGGSLQPPVSRDWLGGGHLQSPAEPGTGQFLGNSPSEELGLE